MKLIKFIPVIFFAVSAHAAPSTPSSEMSEVLQAQQGLRPKPLEKLPPPEARLQPTVADGAQVVLARKDQVPNTFEMEKIYNIEIPGPASKLPARIYKPAGKNLPITVYFQGGGFVIADLDTYEGGAYGIAKNSQSIVVSVEYRKAPEHKFPAAHDDAFAAYKWVLENAAKIGGDKNQVSVAGESAGGNLAINVSMRARDEGVSMPKHQVLVYPVAGNDMNTESYKDSGNAKPLNKPMMEWFFKHYLVSPDQAKDARLNLVAANLRGLPPTTLILADIDPLRSEGQLLGEKLKAQGVQVRMRTWEKVTHEFFGLADIVPQAKEAQTFAAEGLKMRGTMKMRGKVSTREE